MPGTPQATAPPPGIYQQRFVPAQGYVLPQAGVQGQTRFPTPQQTPHQGLDAAHFQAQGAPGSAAASTGPNSQPPTPGPSPAQVYGMYSAPTGQGMVVYGGPGGVPMAVPPAHHDPAMMQQAHTQQQQQQQQQGGGGVPQPPHQQYAMAHEGYGNFVQAAPFYQQPPPNQMSRQNSAPQAMYQQQGPGVPPPQQQQAQPPNPPSTAPPQQQ
ncbi:unnamed protein product [Nippostrongylus brasiliensis]|uniref:Translation initiation factor if-2 n=1 Tax=Nippostrongylus brasiliensis TaxID=27835 RepID=A0A0N4YVF7_NIPBR|nr:unnamed protein product [Nippostrongylus brasiliensis]